MAAGSGENGTKTKIILGLFSLLQAILFTALGISIQVYREHAMDASKSFTEIRQRVSTNEANYSEILRRLQRIEVILDSGAATPKR